MSIRVLMRIGATAAVFLAGFWIGGASLIRAESNGRVFELRKYIANEGKLAELNARFRDHTLKLFQKHGITSVGYWVPSDDPLSKNTLIYLLAFPNRDAAKKSWEAFGNDPEWKKVQQESEANGAFIDKIESVFMDPTDYSPMK